MTQIKPFKAVIYNQEKITNLAKVTCPPYDIISTKDQQYYHELNPYNLIHILLGKDISGDDKYKRAGKYFRQWLNNKMLIQEKTPAIYFYSHQYNLSGEKRVRLGFIALLRLKDRNSAIFGHEHTHLEPKEDRFRLIKQVKANLSPIFVIFTDKWRIVQRVYNQNVKDEAPFIDIVDRENNVHKLWRIDDKATLEKMQNALKNESIYIADGHHRYEVALTYRELMKRKEKGLKAKDKDYNYLLAYFTNTDPRGLTILPVHRLLKLKSQIDSEALKQKLKDYFDVEEVKEKTRFLFLLKIGGRTEHVLGMYMHKKYYLLRLKNITILNKLLDDKSKEYRTLDVAILNYLILDRIFKIDLEDKGSLTFSPDADGLIEQIDNNQNYLAFFLNPVRIEQIISVSANAERMPPKSTYFYPKVLSGLVINKFD